MSIKKGLLMNLIAVLSIFIAACSQDTPDSAIKTDKSNQEKTQENEEKPEEDSKNNKSNKDEQKQSKEKNPSSDKESDDSSENQNDSTDKQKIEDNGSADEKLLPGGTLSYGDTGEKVSMLQEAVNRSGYSLTVDRDLDWTTVWALKDFQAHYSALKVDGIYGQGTREYILKAINREIKVNPGTGLDNNNDSEENNENQDNSKIVSDPTSILALVNKNNQLPEGYIPNNLVEPNVRFPFTENLPKK